MEQSHNSSRRLLWAGVGVAVIILLVALITMFTLMGTKKDTTPVVSNVGKTKKVATNDEVKQDLAKLDASLKQFTDDLASAKAVQKDNTNQIKVGK
jgi:flagellar basal body-associated protein FliL